MKHVILPLLLITLNACGSTPPAGLTTQTPCPNAPKCVSTYSKLPDHKIKPYTLNANSSWVEFTEAIKNTNNVKIIQETPTTLHSVFTTKIMRFQDDVLFKKEDNTIHFRSASRVGYYDMGANRDRMENLRKQLQNLKIIK